MELTDAGSYEGSWPDGATPPVSMRTWARRSSGASQASYAQTELAMAYAVNHDRILARVIRSTRNADVAEELLQEAFLRLLVVTRDGGMPANVGGWLHRVTMNLATDHARQERAASRIVPTPAFADETPETQAIERERASALHAALDQLPVVARRAMLMDAEGYRSAEIGIAIGRTDVATRTLLCRARRRARELLEAQAW